MARELGGQAVNEIGIDAPLSSIRDAVSDADLVLRGDIVALRTRLNADESTVETEYSIRPTEAFKDRLPRAVPTPGTVPTVLFRRGGGRLVTEDGLRVGTAVSIFPEGECFSVGEDVVVMLTYVSAAQVYRFSRGAFGAFRIRSGVVTPMTSEVANRRKDVPTPVGVFLADLRRMVR
jgi:hypothetical protein